MFSKTRTEKSTKIFSDKIELLSEKIKWADALIVGAGAGLAVSAGFTYSGKRFAEHFSDFKAKYGFSDMYFGGFYPYETLEEYWAYWSRYIYINRYVDTPKSVYSDLLRIVKKKDYFVITTNVDHQFQKAGFDKKRLFYTQGDYGLFQCSKPCCNKTYDNETAIYEMVKGQSNMKIPTELIPKCPVCNAPMSMNLRCDDTFVQDNGWYRASERYSDYLRQHKNLKILFLELGVGGNTPIIIKYPFWKMTAENKNAFYACINFGEAMCPTQIEKQSVCLNCDIGEALEELISKNKNFF